MCPRQRSGVNYTGLCIPSIARIIFPGKSDGNFEERCVNERMIKIMSRIKLDGVLGNDALMNG